MKAICISDTHNTFPDIDDFNADILIHCGDFTNKGTEEETFTFLKWYKSLHFKYKLFIGGNHDRFCEDFPDRIKSYCNENNLIYLCDSGVKINNINFWGSPHVPYCGDFAFVKYDYEIFMYWNLIPEYIDVLITHSPPAGVGGLGVIKSGQDVGCSFLTNRVNIIKPKYHVFGHVHNPNLYRDKNTVYINCATSCYFFSV